MLLHGKISSFKDENTIIDNFELDFDIKDMTEERDRDDIVKSIFHVPSYKYHYIECPVAKLYRREFLIRNSIEFKKGIKFGEDAMFNYIVSCNTKEFVYINKTVYMYRIHNSSYSIAYNPQFKDDVMTTIASFEKIISKKEHRKWFNYYIFAQTRKILQRYLFNVNNESRDKKTEYYQIRKNPQINEAIEYIKITKLKKVDKFFAVVLKMKNYFIVMLLCNLINKRR